METHEGLATYLTLVQGKRCVHSVMYALSKTKSRPENMSAPHVMVPTLAKAPTLEHLQSELCR